MSRLPGTGASDGIAIGPAQLLTPAVVVVDRAIAPSEVVTEVARLTAAVAATDRDLAELAAALEGPPRDAHLIIDAHRLMLVSDELIGAAKRLIASEQLAAESAVRRVINGLVAIFDGMKDRYLRERGQDVEAVGERLISTLLGLPVSWSSAAEVAPVSGSIGVGRALSPLDAFHLERLGLVGVASEHGGRTSHASIIVRALGLPYVLGVHGLGERVAQGDLLIVDGGAGEVIVNPDPETLRLARVRQAARLERTRKLAMNVQRPAVTLDGTRVEIGANIEALVELGPAIELGAESVGLFRTELLYLDRLDLPTEDEQYRDASAALTALGGRVATFRTLDLGGEKLPLAVDVPEGANPSLGVRAIRFSLRRPEIFRTQLRALYRASANGPLRIMFPLISGVSEMRAALKICAAVRAELDREGLAYRADVPIGAMLETPSAVMTVDHLATCCDFFSVGTNDLAQYTFAADRENQDVGELYQPLHPALVRLLARAADAADQAGVPISVCGDMAADPAYTWVLLGLGFRELSMAPRSIPAVKSVVAGTELKDAIELTVQLAALGADAGAADFVLETMRRRFPFELEAELAARHDEHDAPVH